MTPRRASNPLSIAGVGLTTASAVAFLTYYVLHALDLLTHPYAGLLGFIFIPFLFVVGLLMIPFGIWRESRRRAKGREWNWPTINFASSRTRSVAGAVFALTLANLAIIAVAGFGAGHYMESTSFCGQVCHEPMKPQYVALQAGAHARVGCVECHISPGASGAIKAKMNGTRQLYEVAVGHYPRPIRGGERVPAAVDTCVTCHRPGFTPRDTTKVIREYADDEANTETVTTLDMATSKIHWHARPDLKIEYAVSDQDPNVVTYVRSTQGTDAPIEYFAPNVTAAPATPLQTMDCRGCHSRPAHAFAATAERTVDNAIGAGLIDRTLPFVRREAVTALKADYQTEDAALAAIEKHMRDFYAARPAAEKARVDTAVHEVQRLYKSNVFPEMKITWGTYLPQNSHIDAPGCFRCHTDELKSRTNRVVSQDCELCHKQR